MKIFDQNNERIAKDDHVLVDGKWPGEVLEKDGEFSIYFCHDIMWKWKNLEWDTYMKYSDELKQITEYIDQKVWAEYWSPIHYEYLGFLKAAGRI